jgi:RNA polymerase sigma-70 factor (ECF subfamily)
LDRSHDQNLSRRSAGAEPSDGTLVRRLRQGSGDAATQLYLRYVRRLRALARARSSTRLSRLVDADDIVQSIFGSFFRGAGQRLYDVPVGDDLWRLLVVIALNKIRSKANYFLAAKRDARLTVSTESVDEEHALQSGDAQEDLALLRLTVNEALERLSPLHRQVINLRIDGHEVAEIAAKTARSHRTVERILQQARQRLTELLEGD